MSDYISRQDAVEALDGKIIVTGHKNADAVLQYMKDISNKIKSLPSADVVPYSIESDGTLIITVPKGTYKNITRVLVEEDGTHWGGLYYAD